MQRFTISLDDHLAHEFDELIAARGYDNRSEAVRDLLRAELERQRQQRGGSAFCVASLSYVYNHHQRDLAERMTALQHEHHPVHVATMHVHLDHDHCLETVVLRGATAAVQAFAGAAVAERGVRHGAINLISTTVSSTDAHAHGGAHGAHGVHGPHLHVTPTD